MQIYICKQELMRLVEAPKPPYLTKQRVECWQCYGIVQLVGGHKTPPAPCRTLSVC